MQEVASMDKKEYITKMEQALHEVNQIKQQLQKNAAEVKSEIHSGISRQLEALRNREVWLLNQVEIIQNMKDEVLHAQQARLNKMLGVAQSVMADSLGNELVNSSQFKPEENPWIVFKCDPAKLRESITSYGRVESSNRPPASVFVKPGHPARSLPPHFEDYDDADHHILYKTVEGVTRSTENTMVKFTLPNLPAKDWLAHSTSTSTSSSTSSKPKFSFPAMSSSNTEWLKRNSNGSSTISVGSMSPLSSSSTDSWQVPRQDTDASITMWLKDIKQNPVIEDEDDFEVISKRDFIGIDRCSNRPSVTTSRSAPDLKTLEHDIWLKVEPGTQYSHKKSFNLPTHLENSSTETWLCKKWKRNAKSSCVDKCGYNKPLEIENICDYLSNKVWIQSTTSPEICQMDICKANEPCQSPDCCVSTPHCFYSTNQSSYLPKDDSAWLLNGGKNVKPTTESQSDMFEKLRVPPAGDNINAWLKSGSIQQRNLDDWKTKPIKLDEKIWIRKDPSNVHPDSTTPFRVPPSWDKVMTFHSQIRKDQWLHLDSDEKDDKMKENSPWILNCNNTLENDPWINRKNENSMDIVQ